MTRGRKVAIRLAHTQEIEGSNPSPASSKQGNPTTKGKPMLIGIYKSHSKTERNKGFAVLYAFNTDWEEGALRQRCLLGNRRFVRDAFPDEIAEHERAYRAISYSYPDVDTLLADERRSGCDESTIEEIRTALS